MVDRSLKTDQSGATLIEYALGLTLVVMLLAAGVAGLLHVGGLSAYLSRNTVTRVAPCGDSNPELGGNRLERLTGQLVTDGADSGAVRRAVCD